MYCNLQMENNLLYFSVATAVSLATNGVEVREEQNEQSPNITKMKIETETILVLHIISTAKRCS